MLSTAHEKERLKNVTVKSGEKKRAGSDTSVVDVLSTKQQQTRRTRNVLHP